MSLQEKLAELEFLVGQMQYVKKGAYVLAKHTNVFIDYSAKTLEFCKQAYEEFKLKTGKTLADVELWLAVAEDRVGMMRRRMFGDVVAPRDHNLVIDTLKVFEYVIKKIEESL